MHDKLFENQRALEDEDLSRYAAQMSLDTARFERELAERAHALRVNDDVGSGLKSGVKGTPTFFVNGLRHDGPSDLATLRTALEETPR